MTERSCPGSDGTSYNSPDSRSVARTGCQIVAVITMVGALICAGTAQGAPRFDKLGSSSDQAETASATILTLYPVLSAGQRPYNYFDVTLSARPAQSLAVNYTVTCMRGSDEASRDYSAKARATTAGTRYFLRLPLRNARYCSVWLTADGTGFVKATLWGRR